MDCSRKLLSIVLAGLLVFANVACACASAADSGADSNPHAHHQMQDDRADVDISPCPHEDCEDCEAFEIAATPERDVGLSSFGKLGLDDDVVWIESAAFVIRKPSPLLARAGPLFQRPSWRAETPVRRADLLLE